MKSCHKATHLISESRERPLKGRERLALVWHLAICSMCRRFKAQVRFMDELGEYHTHWTEHAMGDQVLSAEARQRIARAMRESNN